MAESGGASVEDGDDRVAVTAGGVHVSKWVEPDGSPVPVVKYELSSVRDDTVRVSLADRIPESLDPDEVGFHDEYHGDRWEHAEPRTIRFETLLPAGETVSTVYGIRRDSIDDRDEFLGRPEITISSSASASETGDDPDAAGADDADADSQAVTDASTGDGATAAEAAMDESPDDGSAGDAIPAEGWDADDGDDSTESGDATEGEDDGEDVGTLSLDDPESGSVVAESVFADGHADGAADGASTSESDDADGDSHAEAHEPARSPAGAALLDRLVEALRADDVDEETREALARELNLQLSASSSQFVEHLQSRVKEKRGQLEADVENLEDSIAELYGVKADASAVADLRAAKADEAALDGVAAAVDDLEETRATVEALTALESDVDDLEAAAATEGDLDAAVDDLESALDALDERVATVSTRTASEYDLATLARDVGDLDERAATQSALATVREDLDALADEVAALESDLADVERSLADRVDDAEAALDARLDREVVAREHRLDAVESTMATDDDLEATTDRVAALEEGKASADRVAEVEAVLDSHYVTEADITAALESRLQRSLFARTLLVAGGMLAGAGITLVATGTSAGAVLAVGGLAAFAYWWWLNDQELQVDPDGPLDDDATGADDGRTDAGGSDGRLEAAADDAPALASASDGGGSDGEDADSEDVANADD